MSCHSNGAMNSLILWVALVDGLRVLAKFFWRTLMPTAQLDGARDSKSKYCDLTVLMTILTPAFFLSITVGLVRTGKNAL